MASSVENANFVQAVEDHEITFIGPTAEHIRIMGDKITAKDTAKNLGIPGCPWLRRRRPRSGHGAKVGRRMGFPVIIKATAGGGGRGMKVAKTAKDLEVAFRTRPSLNPKRHLATTKSTSRNISRSRAISKSRFSATARAMPCIWANAIARCNAATRRCSKKPPARSSLPKCAPDWRYLRDAVAKINYIGAGTVEFLFEDGEFYFIEMNTRLQVEHPVTEAIFGVDLVREQIRVAAGLPLEFSQDDLVVNGHSIEVRLNAEKLPNFTPSPGRISQYHAPGGLGVRMDSALYDGYSIPPYYDSLIGKLIVHGRDRPEALARLRRALGELIIDGIDTSVPLFAALLDEQAVQDGSYDIHWMEKWLETNLG